MQHRVTFPISCQITINGEVLDDVDFECVAYVTPGHPGRWGGPPELCEPPDPGEVEVVECKLTTPMKPLFDRDEEWTENERKEAERQAFRFAEANEGVWEKAMLALDDGSFDED